MADFAGKISKMPLRNSSLWLDWDLALAITGHDAEVKETYENLVYQVNLKLYLILVPIMAHTVYYSWRMVLKRFPLNPFLH